MIKSSLAFEIKQDLKPGTYKEAMVGLVLSMC